MAQARLARLNFNRGLLSPLAAARKDLDRNGLSADISINWMPRSLGSMMLRPGWEYIGASASNALSKSLRFVRSATNKARLECTANGLRVWYQDALVTRVSVATTIANGGFDANVASWTDADEAGATSAWLAGGYLSLIGNGTNAAIRTQQVTVAAPAQNVEHALRIIIARGPVVFRCGSTSGGDEYITETTLGTGTHSLAFTPTGDFHLQFSNARLATSLVDSIQVEAAGVMVLPVPWAAGDLASIRYDQSADVLYVGSQGFQQRKIERRGNTSWSIVLYEPEDGPFRLVNTTSITIAASAISGDVTLTASKALFRSGHVGALFRLTSSGQLETAALTGADQFTAPIRVIGVGGQRAISILITGTWVATLTLQYSVAAPGTWVDVLNFTTNQAISYNDELDNQIVYYRIGIKGGNYTSGTANATLVHTSGSTVGIARITAYSSATSVSAAVIDTLGSTVATSDWNEGTWSSYRGYPNVPILHEGRLWHWGRDRVAGSESDLYEDFDDTEIGDAGPIQRSIGSGPVETVHWAASLTRMLVGVATMSADVDCGIINGNSPLEARSTSFDDPLTPTNFNMKRASATAVYVDQSAARLFEADFNVDRQAYETNDLSLLVPELNASGITVLGVQHRPDTRIHCRRNDGSVGVLVFDKAENVICWTEVITSGVVEDVCILPGAVEDDVYYTVQRTINGSTVRYHEKWALESECIGGILNKQADSFLEVVLVATIDITNVTISVGLTHIVTLTTLQAHGLAVSDVIDISDMLASGDYDLNGERTVTAIVDANTFRVTVPKGITYFPNGSYISGGSFASGDGAAVAGLDHLEGQAVVAWGGGVYLGIYTVSAGAIALSTAAVSVIVGLPYTANWQGTKNAVGDVVGASLGQPLLMSGVSLVLKDTHATGLRYGQDFDHLNGLPSADLPVVAGIADEDHVYPELEGRNIPLNGEWKTDSRLCLQAVAPKPCTILAAIAQITG